MSTLQDSLNSLIGISDNVASIEFKRGYTQLADDLIQKRKLVRDTDTHESKLASICLGGSLLTKITDITKNTSAGNIPRILSSINALNQICQDAEVQEKVQDLSSEHEERNTNLRLLRTSYENYEQEIDMLTIENTEKNMVMEKSYENDESDVIEEESEIQQLEEALEEKRNAYNSLVKKKEDHLKIQSDLKELNIKGSNNMNSISYKRTMDKIEQLEKDIKLKKRRINDFDSVLHAMEEAKTTNNTTTESITTKEIYTEYRARIENLLQSSMSNAESDTDVVELTVMFKSIEAELLEIIDRLKEAEQTEEQVQRTRSIYLGLLEYIQNQLNGNQRSHLVQLAEFKQLFPHNTHTSVPELQLSKDAVLITPILSKLFAEKQVKLSTLTTFVEDLAKEQQLLPRHAIQSIYKLVAANMILIDRSHKDSLVQLKLS